MKTELASWIGTYWVHSSLILGAAWLLLRTIPRDSHRLRESIWKTALLAGFVTASIQSALPALVSTDWPQQLTRSGAESSLASHSALTSAAGSRTPDNLPTTSREASSEASPAPSASLAPAASPAPSPSPSRFAARITPSAEPPTQRAELAAGPSVVTSAPNGNSASTSQNVWELAPSLLWLIATLWFGGALIGSIRWARARRQLFRRIDPRKVLERGALFETLQDLTKRASVRVAVRLTDSPQAPSPMALNRAEICIPAASMTELSQSEQRAMLAHELGHIVRKDPLWLAFSHWIETLFFFQPLNRVARKEIQREAEFLADDWALAHSEGGLVLARCLATVADWVGAGQTRLSTVSAMAEHDSSLVDRVQRLVDGDAKPSRNLPTWIRVPLVGILCTAVIWVAPRVAARSEEDIKRAARIIPAAVAREGSILDLPSVEAVHELRAQERILERALVELRRKAHELDRNSQLMHERAEILALESEATGSEGRALREYEGARRLEEQLQRKSEAMERLQQKLSREEGAMRRYDEKLEREHYLRQRAIEEHEHLLEREGERLHEEYRQQEVSPEVLRRLEKKLEELENRLHRLSLRSGQDNDQSGLFPIAVRPDGSNSALPLVIGSQSSPGIIWAQPDLQGLSHLDETPEWPVLPDLPSWMEEPVVPIAPVSPRDPWALVAPLFPTAPDAPAAPVVPTAPIAPFALEKWVHPESIIEFRNEDGHPLFQHGFSSSQGDGVRANVPS